jgi:hypothetical protein
MDLSNLETWRMLEPAAACNGDGELIEKELSFL